MAFISPCGAESGIDCDTVIFPNSVVRRTIIENGKNVSPERVILIHVAMNLTENLFRLSNSCLQKFILLADSGNISDSKFEGDLERKDIDLALGVIGAFASSARRLLLLLFSA